MTAMLSRLRPRATLTRSLPSPPGREFAALQWAAAGGSSERRTLRERFMAAASSDGAAGAKRPGVRWWLKYIVYGRSTSPITCLTASSPHAEKLEAEQLLMDFIIWLATCSPSGQQISAKTIRKYVSEVRAWHLRTQSTHLCGDLDYSRVRDLIKSIARTIKQPETRRRWGVRTQDLAKAIMMLDTSTDTGSMWAAALSTAFCGLLRGAELGLQEGEAFDAVKHLTRADVSFRTDAAGRRFMVLRMRPAKKPGATKSVPLLIEAGGTMIDAVAAIERMIAIDPVPIEERATTPLFRLAGRALTVSDVRVVVKGLMQRLGLDPRRFGAHSLRIGGATAALAAHMSPAAIRAAGRWASDVYILYTRASRAAAAGVARVIGSTPFEDLERGVEFIDEELTLTTAEMPAGRLESFMEQDLIEDALMDDAGDEEDVM